jgi:hypothetical protein
MASFTSFDRLVIGCVVATALTKPRVAQICLGIQPVCCAAGQPRHRASAQEGAAVRIRLVLQRRQQALCSGIAVQQRARFKNLRAIQQSRCKPRRVSRARERQGRRAGRHRD